MYEKLKYTFYPNPAEAGSPVYMLYVPSKECGEGGSGVVIRLYSVDGRLLKKEKADFAAPGKIKMETSGLAPGVYFYVFGETCKGGGTAETQPPKKFIIKR